MQPSYFAVIPAAVRYHNNIKPGGRLLYGEIVALCSSEGYCWASNSWFAKMYSISVRQVQRWIAELAEAGFIRVEYDEQNKNNRRIFIADEQVTKKTYDKKVTSRYDLKVSNSNTRDSNTSRDLAHVEDSDSVIVAKPQKTYSTEVEFIAKELYRHVIENYPHLEKRCDWQKWCDPIEKLNRIDGYDYKTIMLVMKWTQQDDFWKQNILSGQTLRKQFTEKLLPRIKGAVDKRNKSMAEITDDGTEVTASDML